MAVEQDRESVAGSTALKKRGITRRELCFGIGGAAALVAMGGLTYAGSTAEVRPPGGGDEARLVSACVRCQKCYEVCPRGVIAPAHLEDGIVQVRTPKMYFEFGYCDFCNEENGGVPLCVSACPTQALALPAGARAEQVSIGKARIDEDTCLAFRLTGCRFCHDACPYDAIWLDASNFPHVDQDKCNGCGACESVCVSLQQGALESGATRRAAAVYPIEGA